MGRSEAGNPAWKFLACFRFHQHDGLSERDVAGQQHQRAVRAYGDGEGFFLKRLVLRRLAANDERHVQQAAGAASSFDLSGWWHLRG